MPIKTANATTSDCHLAQGGVIVIDVIRAFTTAAFAFDRGAKEIILVSGVDEAFQLRETIPGSLIMGEVNGVKVDGFDFGNSPETISKAEIRGKTLIQRTTAGTQGVTRSVCADPLLAGSFCCARATLKYFQNRTTPCVTLVVTGTHAEADGDEDIAFSEYMTELFLGNAPDPTPYLQRVRDSSWGRKFNDPSSEHFPMHDLDYCTALDRFDFAMVITRENGRFIARAQSV